jgi:hypothetical protein
MNMDDILLDDDIKNYTIDEFKAIFREEGAIDLLTKETVESTANMLIIKHPELRDFFMGAKAKLLKNIEADTGIATKNKVGRNKYIYVNSAFRKNNVVETSSYSEITTPHTSIYSETKFTFSLGENLKDVSELLVTSVQIPFTWYNIDEAYNNNYFWLNGEEIRVESGYYTKATLISAVSLKMQSYISLNITHSEVSGKATISNMSTDEKRIEFHRNGETFINNNLGWILGYRDVSYNILPSEKIKSEALINVSGFQHFFILMNDFNNSQDNQNIISIEGGDDNISIPNYYSDDLRILDIQNNIPAYGQGIPFSITKSQQYTINEILKARNKSFNKLGFNATSDVLAIIPVNIIIGNLGESVFTNSNHNTAIVKRRYFGSVNIDRMQIELVNDYGQTVNLNGSNWSFLIESTHEK